MSSKEIYDQLYFLRSIIGPIPSPFDCYLVLRSCKTLSVRMKQIGENALAVAKHLESHPKVEKVYYPGLESHKYYEVHKKQAQTGAGVISFVIKDADNKNNAKMCYYFNFWIILIPILIIIWLNLLASQNGNIFFKMLIAPPLTSTYIST